MENAMTVEQFEEIMSGVCSYYGSDESAPHRLNKKQMEVWYDEFKHLTKEEFKEVWTRHIRQSHDKFFPALGEVMTVYKTEM